MSNIESNHDSDRATDPSYEISDPVQLVIGPLVSVFMITYNHELYIDQAIEGVLAQETDFPIELVIGEDFSSDNTREIIMGYQKRYPSVIRLITADENVGIRRNVFRTQSSCRGKYVAYCEGDDYWIDSKKLAKQIEVMNGGSGDIAGCFHDTYVLRPDGKKSRQIGTRKIDKVVDSYSLLKENNIATVSMLYDRIKVGDLFSPKWFLDCMAKGDYAVALMVAKVGNWCYIDEAMSVYRIHDGGVWSMKGNRHKAEQGLLFFKLLRNFYHDKHLRRIVNEKIRLQYFNLSLVCMRERRPIEALCALLRVFSVFGRNRVLKLDWFKYMKTFVKMMIPVRRNLTN